MKPWIYLLLMFSTFTGAAQPRVDSLHTAKNCSYMTARERDMIYEINRVRSDPRSYLPYLEPLLAEAERKLKEYGKGLPNYSLTYYGNDKKNADTTWHFVNEEEYRALSTLIDTLKKMKPLSVLLPDAGIYKAAASHAADQDRHDWSLGHTGSDGSAPWDRITRFSPKMSFGNENIAGNSFSGVTARDIVIQLLVDSGIPGYGHRYNLLDPAWTHVACKGERYKGIMDWWIQDFGVIKPRMTRR